MMSGLSSRWFDGLPMVKEDHAFCERCLAGLTEKEMNSALAMYRQIWLEAQDREPRAYKKDNAGRFAANTFLRELTCSH